MKQELERICALNPENLGAATPQEFIFKYIDISSVEKGRIHWGQVSRYKFSEAPSRARRRVKKDDVLLCTVRPGLQAHARIPKEDGVPFIASTGFAALRPYNEEDSSFIFHQLFSNDVVAQLRSKEVGSSYPAVNESDVRRLSIFMPEPSQRKAIGKVLDTIDETIAQTEAVITKLKQVRAGMLHDLLSYGLDEHGQLRDPVAHPEQFKDSPLGLIPREWDVGTVKSLAINKDSKRIPVKQADRESRHGLYPYYGASGIIDYIDDFIFEGDFVLIGEDGENLRSRQLPLAFIATGKFWVNNHAHILEPLPETDVRFLATILENQDFIPWLLGSAQPKLTQRNLEIVPLRVPLLDEQKRISDSLERCDIGIEAEIIELRKLKTLKTGIQDDLLTGRVRVPETIMEGAENA